MCRHNKTKVPTIDSLVEKYQEQRQILLTRLYKKYTDTARANRTQSANTCTSQNIMHLTTLRFEPRCPNCSVTVQRLSRINPPCFTPPGTLSDVATATLISTRVQNLLLEFGAVPSAHFNVTLTLIIGCAS